MTNFIVRALPVSCIPTTSVLISLNKPGVGTGFIDLINDRSNQLRLFQSTRSFEIRSQVVCHQQSHATISDMVVCFLLFASTNLVEMMKKGNNENVSTAAESEQDTVTSFCSLLATYHVPDVRFERRLKQPPLKQPPLVLLRLAVIKSWSSSFFWC
jgi:hypothetical protein